MPEVIDISKASAVLARERKTGKAVCLHVSYDIQAALNAAEKVDASKYDQLVIWRKPPAYKRKQFENPESANARANQAKAEAAEKAQEEADAAARVAAEAEAKAEAAEKAQEEADAAARVAAEAEAKAGAAKAEVKPEGPAQTAPAA